MFFFWSKLCLCFFIPFIFYYFRNWSPGYGGCLWCPLSFMLSSLLLDLAQFHGWSPPSSSPRVRGQPPCRWRSWSTGAPTLWSLLASLLCRLTSLLIQLKWYLVRVWTTSHHTRDVKKVEGMLWPANTRNSLPFTVRNFRQRSCYQ